MLKGADDLGVVDPEPGLRRIGAHQAFDARRRPGEAAHHPVGGIIDAHHQHAAGPDGAAAQLVVGAPRDPQRGQARHVQHRVEHQDRARVAPRAGDHRHQRAEADGAEQHRGHQPAQVGKPDVLPHVAVQPEGQQPGGAHQQQQRQGLQHQAGHIRGRCAIEADQERHHQGDGREPALHHHGDRVATPRRELEDALDQVGGIEEQDQGLEHQAEVVPVRSARDAGLREPDLLGQDRAHVDLLGVAVAVEQLGLVAESHRGQIGDPRAHVEDVAIIVVEHLHVAADLGTRADQAHVTAQDVVELRQLVELGMAQEAAETGDTRIVVSGHTRADGIRAHLHGAELVQAERAEREPDALLLVQHRHPVHQQHRQRHHRQQRGQHDDPGCRDDDVDHTFHLW